MKKLLRKTSSVFVFALCFTFLFSLFTACEIGLGSAVDTQAPGLAIDSPKVDSVIRDVFAITGRWSDDGTIKSIRVILKRTDGTVSTKETDAVWEQDPLLPGTGTWKAIIDYQEMDIMDGTYQATVSIKDKGDHETTQSTTFTIDNTAPVLVISRPSIKDGQSGFDNYGRSFTIEGKAADDNDVSHIEVNIYQSADSTVPMKTIGLDNIPLTIEQDVAVYESDKANDYAVIYGHTDENGVIETIGETEQRYCTITIYDGAQRFPVDGSDQTEEDKKGNSTNTYYMNSEIATLLQGAYKITDLYHMMNKNYGTEATRAATANDVISLLEPYKVSKGKFSINPANNPKFILSSGNVLEEGKNLDNVDYQLTAGNRYIEVEISPGLDGYPIDPDTVGVYLLECDQNGTPKNDEKIWLINTGNDWHKTQEEAEGLDLAGGFGIYTVSGSTYKFKTSKIIHKTNYASLKTGNYYLLKVQGNDSQGEESGSIISDGDFGFKLVSNEEKIEISAHGVPDYISTKAEAWTVSGHETFTVTLNWATTTEGPFYVYRQNGSGEDLVATVTTQTNGTWEATEALNYTQLKKLGPSEQEFPDKLTYYLKNQGGDTISTAARINLKYDSDKPSISNVQFSNSHLDEDTSAYFVRNVQNNKSNINGIATDDDTGIEKVELKVGETVVKTWLEGRFKFENIDFSGYTGSGITADIVATDLAGNQEKSSLTIVFDTEAPRGIHEIDASSKNLYFRIGNADNDDVTPSDEKDQKVGGKYGNGTFGNATTIQIRGKFEDNANGSGVKMIYYKVFETEQKLSTDPDVAAEEIKTLKETVINSPTGKFAPIATQTKRVFYNVDRKKDDQGNYKNPPEVDESQIFEGSTAFTTTPNNKGFYKYYKDVESNYNNTLSGFKEGNNYLVLAVEDYVGNTGLDYATVNFEGVDTKFVNYTLNVDTTPPSDITTESHSGIIYTNSNTEPLVLWGTVSDKSTNPNGTAGINTFILSRDGVSTKVTASLREVRTQADAAGNPADSVVLQTRAAADPTLRIWEADVSSLLPSSSGTVSISATATDAAGEGNTTPAVVATVNVDLDPPEVLVSEDSPADADTSDDIIQVNGIISFTGTSDDENGIDELLGLYYKTYTGNTVPSAPAAKTAVPPAGWTAVSPTKSGTTSWKFTNINTAKLDGTNQIADGTKLCFTVAVKDKAGNIGYSAPRAVVVDQDTDRPVIHLTSLPLTYKDEDQQPQRMDCDNPVWSNRSELTGTIDDDDGAVEYVKVIAQDVTETNAPTDAQWAAVTNVYKNGIWAYTISSNGSKKIYFQIKEKGENGKTFTSNAESTTAATYGPKIQDANSVKFGYNETGNTADDILYVKVDTDDPILENMYYYTSNTLIDNPQTAITGWKIADSSIITDKFGGTNKYLYIKCKTKDTNGISSVTLKFANKDPETGKTIDITQASDKEQHKEIITCFDISTIATGLSKLEINIKDNAAANTNSSGIFKYYDAMVDNTEPEINFSNYTSGSQVYGSSSVTLRGTTSDSNTIVKVEYALTNEAAAVPLFGWQDITDENNITHTSKLGWQIVFDDKITTPDTTSFHAKLLKKALFELYEVPENQQGTYDNIEKVYIWLRATDELGNCGTNKYETESDAFYFNVIPNGDRPLVDISYPSNDSSVGGTIRITGSTEIHDTSASVKDVYIQIDPSYNETAGFSSSWATDLQTLMTAKTVTSYQIKDLTGEMVEETDLGSIIGKGIPVQGNSKLNWYLIINGNRELNDKVDNKNRKIGIRAYAVSSTGKVTVSDVYKFEIDPEAPTFGQNNPLRFVQYSDAALTQESASRSYASGLFLKGQWYLVGSVEDESGIREISVNGTNILWTTTSGEEETVGFDSTKVSALDPADTRKFKNYNIKIPVGNTEDDKFGRLDYEIILTDGSESRIQGTEKLTVYYDNKDPSFTVESGNGKDIEPDTGKIYQSNGAYTVRGTYAEPSGGANNQSGFKRIAMFFTRDRVVEGVKGRYILDPMLASGSEGKANFIKLGNVNDSGVITSYSTNVSKQDGLYWYKAAASIDSNQVVITDTSLISNHTIRVGGICMIDNVQYLIKSITGNKLNLDGTLTDANSKDVYIAYALIIDNLSQESGTTVVYSANDETVNKDGDCMVEGVQFSGGQYNWNASLDSSNMLDGNITMSFVAYDAAGNYVEKAINQKISNNAPRIAGVIFGTDTNLNGEVDDNELIQSYATVFTGITNVRDGKVYNGQDENGELITSYEIPVSINVKGAVKVKPMIVGGNTALGWQYTYKYKDGTEKSTGVTGYNNVGHSYDGSVRTNDLSINILLKDFLEKEVKEGNQNLKFTIWDETDGSTLGNEASGSAKADIVLPVNIIIADSSAPTAVVNPFYWKSAAENSIYLNNSANGHIELENELPAGFTSDGSGTLDRDAKVSGMITFDGTATDNVIVEKIKVVIPGYNSGNEFVIAQRDSSATTTAGWTSTNMYHLDDEGNPVEGAAAMLTGANAKPWVFELISDVYDDEGKNLVTFKFHFNTEQISTKAASNVSIKFTAMDKGSPALQGGNVTYANAKSSTPGTTSTASGALTGCYKVDVVPYIIRVKTALSDLKKNNPSVYARSAKGNYGVNTSEVLNIEGFNVSGGTLKFEKTGGGNITAAYNANAGGTGVGGYAIPSTAKSGNLVVTVNSIDSLNNSNNNEAKGSYSGTVNFTTNPTGVKSVFDNYYNRQPNGDNNNLLTDDVVLDVWQFKDAGISQTSGYITEPIMKVNPKNGILNFGFNSGPANYCMGDGQTYSYKTWVGNYARFSTCGFTVDENGVTHGITVGLDTNPGDSHSAGRMQYLTSKWGRSDLNTNGNYEGKNSSRFENIGAPPGTYNGNAFTDYAFIEDRFASPSLATAVHGNDTYVFLAYYDDLNCAVRFRWGNLSQTYIGTNANTSNAVGQTGITFGQFADQRKYGQNNNTHTAFDSNSKPEYFSTIASSGTTAKAGNYVSIDVIKGTSAATDVIVATWYDATASKWWYSYKVNPCNDNDLSATQGDGRWKTPIMLKANAGESCQIAVDKAGGIHIASYDGENADLLYAYLSSYDDTTPQVVTVDSYAFTGTNIRLDTAVSDDGNYIVPYIGYYMSSTQKPKMAYLPDVISSSTTKATREAKTIKAGVDENDAVTGSWESTLIPTSSRVADNYAYCYINIGLYKDTTTGKAKVMSGTDVAYTNTDGLKSENTSKTYGNGTANPVLAYATRVGTRGHLETAQKK